MYTLKIVIGKIDGLVHKQRLIVTDHNAKRKPVLLKY